MTVSDSVSHSLSCVLWVWLGPPYYLVLLVQYVLCHWRNQERKQKTNLTIKLKTSPNLAARFSGQPLPITLTSLYDRTYQLTVSFWEWVMEWTMLTRPITSHFQTSAGAKGGGGDKCKGAAEAAWAASRQRSKVNRPLLWESPLVRD